MPFAMRVHETGGPEVMQWEAVDISEPGPRQVRLRHTAIGLNFLDTYFRAGLYPLPLPFTPGAEAAGVIEAVGADVTDFSRGDRVAYAGSTGAYSEERLIDAAALVRLPDDIDDETAAAVLLQGVTARFLIKEVRPVGAGELLLVHAAAGGVGSLLCQWARALGARPIGTVSSRAKADVAAQNGCEHVIISTEEDFVARVGEITDGQKLDVVFDSIGRDTFIKSLDCLRPRGMMVVFGQSSGVIEPLEINLLARKGSLVLTRPVMPDFVGTPAQMAEAAADLFDAIRTGLLMVRIGQTRPLAEAAEAHRDIAARRTIGSTVFTL